MKASKIHTLKKWFQIYKKGVAKDGWVTIFEREGKTKEQAKFWYVYLGYEVREINEAKK